MVQAVDRAMTTSATPAFTEVMTLKIVHPQRKCGKCCEEDSVGNCGAQNHRIRESKRAYAEGSTSCVSVHYNKAPEMPD